MFSGAFAAVRSDLAEEGERLGSRPFLLAGDQGRRVSIPLHFQLIAHPGACGKTRVVP
jgi:hypothetical protein